LAPTGELLKIEGNVPRFKAKSARLVNYGVSVSKPENCTLRMKREEQPGKVYAKPGVFQFTCQVNTVV
jgi:hypothetical protein